MKGSDSALLGLESPQRNALTARRRQVKGIMELALQRVPKKAIARARDRAAVAERRASPLRNWRASLRVRRNHRCCKAALNFLYFYFSLAGRIPRCSPPVRQGRCGPKLQSARDLISGG